MQVSKTATYRAVSTSVAIEGCRGAEGWLEGCERRFAKRESARSWAFFGDPCGLSLVADSHFANCDRLGGL